MEHSIEYTYRVRWWNHTEGYPNGPVPAAKSDGRDADKWDYQDYPTLAEAENRLRSLNYNNENLKKVNTEILIQARLVQTSEWEKYEGQDK